MRKVKRKITICIALLFVTTLSSAAIAKASCCIGGIYYGEHRDQPSLTCSDPTKGSFEFSIKQNAACDKKLWGKLTAGDGGSFTFEGAVVPVRGVDSCAFEGVLSKPGDTIHIRGTLNKGRATWSCTDGTYNQRGDCNGVFKLKQR